MIYTHLTIKETENKINNLNEEKKIILKKIKSLKQKLQNEISYIEQDLFYLDDHIFDYKKTLDYLKENN